MKNKIKIALLITAGCILAGCTCVSTHVPGRRIDHGPDPGGWDRFFCNLDYIIFPPEQGYVVPPPPPPPPPPPAVVVIPEYGYDWWKGTWVPRYQNWYWYHGTWEWGGPGHRPVPPAWAPDFKLRPMPPPPPRPAVVVVSPPPRPVVVKPHHHARPHHVKPAPRPAPKPAVRPAPRPAPKPAVRPAPRPEPKAAVRPAPRPEPKAAVRPAVPQPGSTARPVRASR